MDVVEISPPYDYADVTVHLGTRLVMDVLAPWSSTAISADA